MLLASIFVPQDNPSVPADVILSAPASSPGGAAVDRRVLANDALPSCGASGSICFAAIGDYGDAGPEERDVANLVKSWSPDFIITTGDNNYPDGEASTIDENIGQYYHEFISPYLGSYGDGSDVNRFFPSLGNHDWNTPNARPYLDYFTLPEGPGNERYYDFTWGPVHFFALDSDSDEPHGNSSNSIQASWLQNQLAASTATWKIVYMHHPAYSSSSAHGSSSTRQWPFQDWGATAVLAGHDHTYERLVLDGLPYFVNGLGGRSIYGFGPPVSGSEVRYNGDYGAMRVQANDAHLVFEFINRTGTVIDTYTITAVDDQQPVVGNQAGTLPSGGTLTLTSSQLSATDSDTDDATLIYTVKSLPTHGQLRRDAVALAVDQTFTQQDITDGKLSYIHDGSNSVSDSFTFTVQDPSGNATGTETFAITVDATSAAFLDVTGSGNPNPFEDGILVVRQMFGQPDPNLEDPALFPANATRTTAAAIRSHLEAAGDALDANGDGTVNPFQDGILIVRYLLDQPDANLENAVLIPSGSTRTTGAAIRQHLESLMPRTSDGEFSPGVRAIISGSLASGYDALNVIHRPVQRSDADRESHSDRVLVRSDRIHAVVPRIPDESAHDEPEVALSNHPPANHSLDAGELCLFDDTNSVGSLTPELIDQAIVIGITIC